MSISGIEDILPRHQEISNGSKKEYTVAFDLIDANFVSVYLGSDKQSSGFNIDVENKKIIFDSAPNSGLLVTIVRAVPVSWESTLHGAINSEGINNLLTHIVASIQTVKEEVNRAVKSNVYDQNDGGQLSEFFLKQLTDARDILDRSENTLSLLNTTIQNALSSVETARSEAVDNINSTYQENLNDINETSSTALSSIGSAKDSAIASIEDLVTSAEESEANAKVSEANAKVSETNAKASETKAQQIADSIVNDSANKDLSNLSATGQEKFNAKQNTITGGATTITSANLTAGRALVSDGSGKVSVSAVTSTELGYLDGVTSNVQTQLNAKQTTDNLSQTLDTSTTKYPSNKAVKAVTDTKANDSNVVHKTGNEDIDGIKTFKQGIKGTFQNYYAYNDKDNTKPYCKVMKMILTGSYQTITIPFIMTPNNPSQRSSTLGQIKLRVDGTAGIINEGVTSVIFPFLPEWSLSGYDFKIIYKNNYPNSNQVLVEFWVKVSNAYNGVCFTILDEIAGGTSKTRDCIWYNNTERYAKLPSDYSVINYMHDVLSVATPSLDSNNKQIANTAWTNSRITSIMNSGAYATKGNKYVKFTNGLIVQWGNLTASSYNATGTVTLPTPFATDDNYSIATVGRRQGGSGQGSLSITGSKVKTSFTWVLSAGKNNFNDVHFWIAIGY